MPDTSLEHALQTIANAGGMFLFSIETPFGATERRATVAQAAAIAAGELHHAALLGLTASEYYDWLEWGGHVQCNANTASGNRCRNIATGPATDNVARWKERYDARPYCKVHGGE